jgi:peptidoglycan/xylan/chitin deacetylase (PgdA/CDA1 family)
VRATAFAAICAQKSSSHEQVKQRRNRWLRVLNVSLMIVLLLPCPPAFADQANVFIYHRFNDARYPSTSISLRDFSSHLDLLHQQGFTVLKLGQVVEKIQAGMPLPQLCAVITVDDAYRSFLTDGWPLLKQYGYPATLFVSTDNVGGGDFLSWQEIQMLQNEGVEIGNHSASHAYLLDRLNAESDDDWAVRVLADLRRAQDAFESRLGRSPKLFAYPYGEFAPALVGLVKKAGFVAAFGQQSGVVTADQDFFTLPRFPLGGGYTSLPEFRSKLFMKALSVKVMSPQSTVILDENPPKLRFYLKQESVNMETLRCFTAGPSDCLLTQHNEEGGLYEVVASQPILGRRSKYTLTASDVRGQAWYWYSQLWVRPQGGEVADRSVPR